MSAKAKASFLQGVLELPTKQRVEIALRIMESLDEEPEPGVEAAWAIEVQDRVEALRSGTGSTRPAAEVFRDARSEVGHDPVRAV